MRFSISKAQRYYQDMFGERIDDSIIREALDMTDEEFENECNQFDEDGEYRDDIILSAGQWDCIDAAR